MQDQKNFLGEQDIAQLTELRQQLHRCPELSGEEEETAGTVIQELKACTPDQIITGLGGHGVAAIFAGTSPGATVMLRCELDALPIMEVGQVAHQSHIPGKAHLCGHDGHMAIMLGVAQWLKDNRPSKGGVILLFQSAEEDGSGAAAVLSDPRFAAIAPDYALALHNFPGIPMGHAVLAPGAMNCASRGVKIRLMGRTAHASEPEKAISPAVAIAALLPGLQGLCNGVTTVDPEFRLVTVTHMKMGEEAFGITPGAAEIWATLRTQNDAGMADLVPRAEALVGAEAEAHGLTLELSYHDIFHHCENDAEAAAILDAALSAEAIPRASMELPMRASEDFGRFGEVSKSAMFLLGAGAETPNLHSPDYDFPDALIPIGVGVFVRALQQVLY